MKKLCLLFIFFCSCHNPKVKIVEQEKEVKKEIALIDAKIDSLRFQGKNLKQTHNDSVAGNWNEYFKIGKSINDSAQKLMEQKTPLMAKYDSLEMELKKY
jgi:hypothetical protein